MFHTIEFQKPILEALLIEPYEIATILSMPLGRTQFNIWKVGADSWIALEIDPALISSPASISESFIRQLDSRGVPHR